MELVAARGFCLFLIPRQFRVPWVRALTRAALESPAAKDHRRVPEPCLHPLVLLFRNQPIVLYATVRCKEPISLIKQTSDPPTRG